MSDLNHLYWLVEKHASFIKVKYRRRNEIFASVNPKTAKIVECSSTGLLVGLYGSIVFRNAISATTHIACLGFLGLFLENSYLIQIQCVNDG